MRHSNIVTLDSKGRLLLPGHIRKSLAADAGTEILLIPDHEAGHLKLLPLAKDRTAELRFLLPDQMGSMAGVISLLDQHKISILLSESRSLVRGKLQEWTVIADTTSCPDLDRLSESLQQLPDVKRLEIEAGHRQKAKGL